MQYQHTTRQDTSIGLNGGPFQIRFPDDDRMDQDEAFCEVHLDGDWQRFRFHDYDEIYDVPGLYEALFYRRLRCCSPRKVVGLLDQVLHQQADSPDPLRVLDVGAGNGMVGEELVEAGAQSVVGLDIIPEAKSAVQRDRPWVYDDYRVVDLCDIPEAEEQRLRKLRLNALTCVAALGFGDIPRRAFVTALDIVETDAWLAFNVKEDFLKPGEAAGFTQLIHDLTDRGVIRLDCYERYQHRLSYRGEPLYYVGVVGRKLKDVPDAFLQIDN